ncbi:5-(carboxyamino)imidazole ribonucleotide mutase [candidate division WOR-1 bacterium RIFOXYA12_FULL_43_27]|uniref:N5-carboxyaminoimidazole ribonucleotide mutase n=1 Tax=candidate division WOR-1 bacterium RIFOXYC2_FULL_46_14 TaxID=1802587 RepID=A0A1F4U645_UNCSA|nr:MAG: 5-(carboxyamino)imidazole ribonucleotide mutase [candidate division WOR-1 bacterium RIFOXYA12_FULL_43_27]OGC20575.1 MAG: 5-(carboxyamino)imidazole ribonucleotide mutase [candidate division WOR-1 bacterium RIFOXYB2_FULL_46_45]OGC31688.1 MAG: 5-(carboxyamino)imidazole ribonucleotide mutase [candidate division WOR-1 bacterium RIFOXYA2_FULL_46_56]OGC40416.1 MAG: 5-(carboxyamino)imidazole ribonucleotide mutase [candidate division WOR-1 bacterium RIFOXYC2_FULL_46_14]
MKVGIICGSESDLPILEKAGKQLDEFGIQNEIVVASAHRSPKKVEEFVQKAEQECDCVIAAAGMSAALPGVIAAQTTLPVIGIPIASGALKGQDALFSIAQMPPGVPVACVAIDGAKNAAILAAQILALKYPALKEKLKDFKKNLAKK